MLQPQSIVLDGGSPVTEQQGGRRGHQRVRVPAQPRALLPTASISPGHRVRHQASVPAHLFPESRQPVNGCQPHLDASCAYRNGLQFTADIPALPLPAAASPIAATRSQRTVASGSSSSRARSDASTCECDAT